MGARWVIDDEHPGGYLVELTAEEEAAFAAEREAAATASAAFAERVANAAAISTAIRDRMSGIRQARTAIGNGNLFAGLSVNEKAVIDGLLEDDLYLARIALREYDGVG